MRDVAVERRKEEGGRGGEGARRCSKKNKNLTTTMWGKINFEVEKTLFSVLG